MCTPKRVSGSPLAECLQQVAAPIFYPVHDYEDENMLTNMVEAANAVMIEKETTEKICVVIREETMGEVLKGLPHYAITMRVKTDM